PGYCAPAASWSAPTGSTLRNGAASILATSSSPSTQGRSRNGCAAPVSPMVASRSARTGGASPPPAPELVRPRIKTCASKASRVLPHAREVDPGYGLPLKRGIEHASSDANGRVRSADPGRAGPLHLLSAATGRRGAAAPVAGRSGRRPVHPAHRQEG